MVSEDEAREMALRLPEATAGAHFENADLRVRNKIFASFPGPGVAVLRLAVTEQAELVALDPRAFEAPDNHWGRQGWTRVVLDRVDPRQLEELLIEAWRLRAPKRLVAEFDAQP